MGPASSNAEVKAEMKRVLDDIQSGRFAKEWVLENTAGQASFKAMRRKAAAHPIEAVGGEASDDDAVDHRASPRR